MNCGLRSFGAGAGMLVAGGALWITSTLAAQPKPPAFLPAQGEMHYDYVGVAQTLARVDRATGRIEILEQENSPRMSLLDRQARPWSWREIPVRESWRPGMSERPRGGNRPSSDEDE